MAPPMIYCREISPSPSNCTSYSPFLQVDTQCSLPSSSFAASCLRVPKNCSLVARCSLKWSEKSSIMPGALVTSRFQEVSTNPVIGEGKIGVLLLNLGGPETLEDVQPFLFNLFADPDIIRLPRLFRFLQRPLAQFISVARAPKSKEGYASIGGGSPLRRITDAQAEALKKALWEKNVPAKVYVGMRYWHPFTEEAIEQIFLSMLFLKRVMPESTIDKLKGWNKVGDSVRQKGGGNLSQLVYGGRYKKRKKLFWIHGADPNLFGTEA